MSSGFGIRGGIGRCYPFYADLKECLKSSESDNGVSCRPIREDYFECLHHNKEYQMVNEVMAQQKKNEQLEKMGEAGGQTH